MATKFFRGEPNTCESSIQNLFFCHRRGDNNVNTASTHLENLCIPALYALFTICIHKGVLSSFLQHKLSQLLLKQY